VSAEYSPSGSYFYDGLEFYIDNNLQGQYQSTTSGESPWTNVSYNVAAGERTFKWTYMKDGGGGSTDCDNTGCADAAWVDDIVFPPAFMESDGTSGDVNMDGIINILDVVVIINMILGIEDEDALADVNLDGSINIQDIILVINLVLGPRLDNASSAQLFDTGASMKIEANGYIGGVQMTLRHGANFSINITDEAMDVSAYRTVGNETVIVIVEPTGSELFTYSGDFQIMDMIIANSGGRVNVIEPIKFRLNSAYPNPFNPSTTISYTLANQAKIDLSVYNISGQLIANLKNGYQKPGSHEIVWDASQQPSGIYLLRLQSENESFNKKLMLFK